MTIQLKKQLPAAAVVTTGTKKRRQVEKEISSDLDQLEKMLG